MSNICDKRDAEEKRVDGVKSSVCLYGASLVFRFGLMKARNKAHLEFLNRSLLN